MNHQKRVENIESIEEFGKTADVTNQTRVRKINQKNITIKMWYFFKSYNLQFLFLIYVVHQIIGPDNLVAAKLHTQQ